MYGLQLSNAMLPLLFFITGKDNHNDIDAQFVQIVEPTLTGTSL